jgi:hypothetical protein
MATPAWNAAAANLPPLAGQLNQFLGAHQTAYLYDGNQISSATGAPTGTLATNGLWIDQPFILAGTQVGRVEVEISKAGAGADVTLGLFVDNGAGNPGGAPLVQVVLPAEFFPAAAGFVTVPLPITGLVSGATYHLVMSAGGDATNHGLWSHPGAVAGQAARTAPAFAGPWSAQAFSMDFKVVDQAASGNLRNTYEDSGVRWTSMDNNTAGQPTILREYTGGQGTLRSVRSLTYTSGQLGSVA